MIITRVLEKVVNFGSQVLTWEVQEFENEEYNGVKLSKGVVLKNGVIREVSVVALGADGATSAEVFSLKTIDSKQGESFMLTKEQWIKLSCGCGGTKDTTPEELESNFAATKEEVDKLKADIEVLKKEIAEKQAIIDEASKEKQLEARTTEIQAKVSEKKLEFKPEVLAKAASSQESKEMFLSMIDGMEGVAKIDPNFAKKVDLSADPILNKEDPASINLRANQLIAEGKAENFMDALSKLGGK